MGISKKAFIPASTQNVSVKRRGKCFKTLRILEPDIYYINERKEHNSALKKTTMDYRKNVSIKTKFINNLMENGGKSKSEEILSKSFKELLRVSSKQFTKIITLFLVSLTDPFRLHTIPQKKQKKTKKLRPTEVPAFVLRKISRVSLAVKRLTTVVEAKKKQKLHYRLKKEIFLGAQSKGESLKLKSSLQKQILTNKHFFSYFKWR